MKKMKYYQITAVAGQRYNEDGRLIKSGKLFGIEILKRLVDKDPTYLVHATALIASAVQEAGYKWPGAAVTIIQQDLFGQDSRAIGHQPAL